MDEAQRRKAANEAVFREVNERIERLQRGFAVTQNQPLHIVCECATIGCQTMLPMKVEEYQRVRAHPRRFFIFPGHDVPDIEDVVERHHAYQVVEKHVDVQVGNSQ